LVLTNRLQVMFDGFQGPVAVPRSLRPMLGRAWIWQRRSSRSQAQSLAASWS
jgi:hypothetical protein